MAQLYYPTPFKVVRQAGYTLNDSNEIVPIGDSGEVVLDGKCVFSGCKIQEQITTSGETVQLEAQMMVDPDVDIVTDDTVRVEDALYRVVTIRPAYHGKTGNMHHKTAFLVRSASDD